MERSQSQRERSGRCYKRPTKRTAKVFVRRTTLGECDQCEMPIVWKNLPVHYANKHKAVYTETWKNRSHGQLIDHAAGLLAKKKYRERHEQRVSDDGAVTEVAEAASASAHGEGEQGASTDDVLTDTVALASGHSESDTADAEAVSSALHDQTHHHRSEGLGSSTQGIDVEDGSDLDITECRTGEPVHVNDPRPSLPPTSGPASAHDEIRSTLTRLEKMMLNVISLSHSDQLRQADIANIKKVVQEFPTLRTDVDDLQRQVPEIQASIPERTTRISLENEYPWFIVKDGGEDGPLGYCHTCIRFAHLIASERGGNRVISWTRGVSLKRNIKDKVRGHDASSLHRKYADDQETHLQSLPTAMQAWQDKNDALTRDMLRIAYHNMIVGNSYIGFQKTMTQLMPHLEMARAYGEVQRNVHQKTAAQAVDVFHDLFVMWLREHMHSPSPVTGRARHFHLSADKGTVGNMTRQIVNIRYIDSDGAPVISNLSVDVIRNYGDDDEPGRHETDAVGCFAHIRRSLKDILGFKDDEVASRCMSFSSDNEAVYSGDKAGLAVRWKSHFDNHAFLHLLDRAHKIEALYRFVINQTGPFLWAHSLLHCTIKQVVDTMTSKTMRCASN